MKKILTITLAIITLCSCNAPKNYTYGKSVESTKSFGEETLLSIKNEDFIVNIEKDSDNEDNSFEMASTITDVLIGFIGNIPNYLSQFIKKEKEKFMGTYKAKNSLNEHIKVVKKDKKLNFSIPRLKLTRNFTFKGNKSILNEMNAVTLELKPHILQSQFLAFTIDDLDLKYSKAKLKKNYPLINYMIVISATVLKEDKTKETITASPMVICQSVQLTNTFDKSKYASYYSDVFPTEGIIDFEVSITEINPKKISLEELQTLLSDNNDDLVKLFKAISDALKD